MALPQFLSGWSKGVTSDVIAIAALFTTSAIASRIG